MIQVFIVISYRSRFERIHKVDAVETLAGRDSACGIVLADPVISRKHALLLMSETEIRVRDLGSRNGTRIGGNAASGDVKIVDGSEVEIGPYLLQICFSLARAVRYSQCGDDSTQSEKRPSEYQLPKDSDFPSLTPAQRRVYDLLMLGLIEKEVAIRLGISTHTVHDHAKAIYKALSVSTRGELVARGITHHG